MCWDCADPEHIYNVFSETMAHQYNCKLPLTTSGPTAVPL